MTGEDVRGRVDRDGGGYPGTFADVAAAADLLREHADAYRLDTDRIVAVAPPRPAAPSARPAVPARVRDAVLRCPDRGPEGGLVLRDDERTCCGGGEERTACAAGRGARPGRVTLRECLACRADA